MASIRIDNFSGDTVTVFIDSEEQTVEDDGRVNFNSLEKGTHTLRIHRTRVPLESASQQEEKSLRETLEDSEQSVHIPLDFSAEFELSSSKAVFSVKADVTAEEGKGLDAVFASYSVTPTGAKIGSGRKIFANSYVRKKFISHHLKEAFFPIGVGGLLILAVALFSLFSAIAGKPVNVGGTVFTLPWAAGLTAVAVAVCGYVAFCVANVMKTAKKFSE